MGNDLSNYKQKTQLGTDYLPENLAKLGMVQPNSESISELKETINPEDKVTNLKSDIKTGNELKPEIKDTEIKDTEIKDTEIKDIVHMVPIPEKSTINKNNQKLLIYDDVIVVHTNVTQVIETDNEHEETLNISKNSSLNSDNKNLLLY